jgi:hypothetical protein
MARPCPLRRFADKWLAPPPARLPGDVWEQARRGRLCRMGETDRDEEEAMQQANREPRRHPEKLERPEGQDARGPVEADTGTPRPTPEDELRRADRQQDDLSARARNSGHGKKTADKWNQ